ncbi:MAG TPA: FtsW/RodA/SpoVE family cell cycle protein, partial [Acidothermaceae bacterium]|nr:FtsW/RodA/SpoVE family cell cycle protein [Acidothermaceae bacterium]
HTDFIFAIIGEELGLVGTIAVLILFAVLAYSGIRVAQRSRDMFSRLAASAIVAWLLVQALVNVGAVIGLLPITGIPLPLISAGGSSLIPTMFALGMLMSLARREPSAAAAIAARGPNVFRRGLHKTAVVLHLSRSGR